MFKQHVRSIFSLINMFLLLFQSFMPGIFAFLPTQAHAQEEIATQSAQVEVVAEPETEVLEVTETTKEVVIEEIVEPTAGPVPMTVVDETQEENVWKIDGSTATLALVELGVTYSAPQNDKVQITFTRLPEVAGSLTITELELSTEQVVALGAYSNIAYDITSSMEDGSFEYELKLPLPEGAPDSAQIKYAESVAELSSASAVENEVVTDDAVIASGLEHFTVFVVVYDSNPAITPGSFPSLGFAATSTSEFGDHIILTGTDRNISQVTVGLTNWACENDFTKDGDGNWVAGRAGSEACVTTPGSSYTHPITLNIYEVDNSGAIPAVGSLITSKTVTATIPFRPSWDATCTAPGSDIPFGGTWRDPVSGNCVHGYAFDVDFDLSSVLFPDEVIVAVAYNTSHHGYSPLGVTGPYNSLNMSLAPDAPTVGTNADLGDVFWNTSYAGFYTDSGAGGVGFLRQDTNWEGYVPVIEVIASAPDPDLSGVTFIGSPKYVRENNGTDLAAQIQVPSATTEVNFIVDGNTGSPINVTTVTAGAPAGSEWYRLKTPLSAGEHTITAQVKIGGIWYDVAPTATVYSLDIPWFQYQHPQSGIFYRPTDGFARIRIDDEFNQVRSVTFALYTVTNSLVGNFTVNRAECDLRSEGNYLICDLMRDYSGSLPVLSGGDYYLKLQTQDFAGGGVRYGHGNSRSVTFTIDAQAPVVHSIQSAVPQSIFANTFTAVVDATDDIGLASVDVYYTEKRFDGQCDPNMSKIDQQTVLSPELDGKYHATFNTAALNGEYCFFAVAEDLANSHSNPQQGKAKFVFDNISPVTTLTSPVSGATNRAITIAGSSSDVNTVESVKLSYSVAGQNDWQEITTILNGSDTQPFVFSYAWTPSAQGTYDIMAAGTDSVGNVEHSAYVYGVTYDTTVPATPGLNTPVDGYRTKGVSFTQKWFSVADAVSYEYQSCNNDPGDTSGACSSVKFTQTFNGVNNTTKSVGAGQPNSHFWWRVRAKDSASNWSNWSESRELIIDNSAPTTVWDSLASAYFSTTPVLTGVATDVYLAGIANVSYRVENTNDATTVFDWQNATASDGTFSDITENFVTNLGSLVDGAYTFLVRAIDRAGNQGTATEVELIVDTTDPISTITTYNLEDGEEVQTSTFDGLIEGSATDLPTDIASGVDYVLLSISHLGFGEDEENTQYWDDEAGTWVDESSLFRAIWDDEAQTWEYQLPDTPEGFYTVTSHAVDKAGNVEDTYTIKIVYDKTIPEVTLTINPTLPDANNGWYKTQPTITLTANDNYSVDHIEYQWNSTAGSWTVYSAPLTPPGEGQNILYYRAVDTVGNVSGLGIKEVKYDKTAPVNGPLNVRVENIGSTTATGKWSKPNGDEQVHEYKLSWKHKVTGTEYSDTVSSETFEHKLTNLFDGLWEFRVLALDAAGHSKDASTEFRVGPEPASGTVLGVDTENGLSNQTGTNTVVNLSEGTTGSESSDETSEKATTSEKEESGSVLGESDVACATWKYYLPLILLFTQILLAISLEFAIKQPGIGKLLFAFAISGLLIGSFYLLRDSGCYGDSTGLLQSVAKWFALISLLLAFVLRRLGSITVEEK